MREPAATVNLERISKVVTGALWGIALVAMIGSATDSWTTFSNLHATPAHGTITALTVDTSLAVWLYVKKRLHDAGITSPWGHVHEWITGGMTAYLNAGAALFLELSSRAAKLPLTIAYCFVPATLILSCLTFGDALLRLRQNRRDQEAHEKEAHEAQRVAEQARIDAERREHAEIEMRRARGELVTAQDVLDKAAELRGQAQEERAQTDREVAELARLRERIGQGESKPHEVVPTPRPRRPKVTTPAGKAKSGPTKHEECKAYVMAELIAGRSPKGADLDRQFGLPRSTGARIIHAVEDQLRRTKLYVVEG